MMPEAGLIELLERIGAQRGAAIFISDHELSNWSSTAIVVMKSSGLITKAHPATSTECCGCERACIMPVHVQTNKKHQPSAFVVCDKRSDINRVPISICQLERWQASGDSIAALLAKLLELPHCITSNTNPVQWEVGVFKGKKHASHIVLQADGTLKLTLAGHSIALTEVLSLEGEAFKIDKQRLAKLIDKPATGGGNNESAAERKKRFMKRKAELIRKGHKSFLKIIAEEEGITDTRVKQILSHNKKDAKKDLGW